MINIIGLGAGSYEELTLEACRTLKNGNRNFTRTKETEAIKYFEIENIPYISFDDYYEDAESFDEVYKKIVSTLLEEEKSGDINYSVPGHPLVAERTVRMLIESGVEYKIISGLSFIEPTLNIVKKDISEGFILLDALEISDLMIDPKKHVIITQVYNERILSDMKLLLSSIYVDEYEVYLVVDAGLESESGKKLKIEDLDRGHFVNHRTCLFIPKSDIKTILDLEKILKEVEVDESLEEISDEFITIWNKIRVGNRYGYWEMSEIFDKISKK